MNDNLRIMKELPFSYFQGLATAKPGPEHVVNPKTRPSTSTHGLPLPGQGGGANAARARSGQRLLVQFNVFVCVHLFIANTRGMIEKGKGKGNGRRWEGGSKQSG